MILKKVIFHIIVFFIIFLISVQYLRMIQLSFRNLKQILFTSEEQRKGRLYESFGYTYIKEVISQLPEPWIFPVTRYVNYTHVIDAFLPIHVVRIDPRVLIGINIPDVDTKEAFIASAQLRDGYWAFHTTNDYDTLTVFRVVFDAYNESSKIQVILYSDTSLKTILGTWEINGDRLQLPEPLHHFSFTRGSRDFILKFTPSTHIVRVDVYGIKVDLTNYEVAHRQENNFTAIEKSFLARMRKDQNAEWLTFLNNL